MLVTGGVVVIGLLARAWMHRHFELVDNNDLPMLGVADAALNIAICSALLVVVIAHLMLDRQRSRIKQELVIARTALHEQLEQESQMRRTGMLGALAGGLAHELGQPLSAARVGVEGFHYLRQLGRESTADHVERTLAQVGMSLLTMTQTIEHLRGLATTSDCAALSCIDLGEMITALLADRDQWLRYRDARIDFKKPDAPIMAMAQPAGVRLVLTNLLRNAVEAVSGQSGERRVVRIIAGPGSTVAVQDSGPGIPAALRERLFDPFFSTKDGAMRGIGLSLARASVLRMRGDLRFTSELGSGTTFSLHLLSPEQYDNLQAPVAI
ncbi:MAG TPA: ATP-binding protein [Planctomycetota bacterium]|nr:ATP-binding protein [Planctomycetota bacterium]